MSLDPTKLLRARQLVTTVQDPVNTLSLERLNAILAPQAMNALLEIRYPRSAQQGSGQMQVTHHVTIVTMATSVNLDKFQLTQPTRYAPTVSSARTIMVIVDHISTSAMKENTIP